MIRAEKLTKQVGDLRAVDAIDLEIPAGEVFGLLGPNGAGKTTTVRMLSALVGPSAGVAHINGFDVARDGAEVRRCVGILTETPGLYERLTAWENLSFFAGLHAIEDADRAIRRYLELLGLWDRRDDLTGGFSKGMRQKLAIARALLHEPRVLFLDEPTAGLDPTAAKVVRDFVDGLRDEGRTIVLCTHNLDEAQRLCDRIAVMKGSLLRVDTPANLRQGLWGSRVSVTLRAVSSTHVEAAGRAVPGAEVSVDDDRRLLVTVTDADAQTPALVRALVEAGADVLQVQRDEASLEAVYFDLVGDDAPPAQEVSQ